MTADETEMKHLLWRTSLTLLGLAIVAGSMVLHNRSQERYDMVWLAVGEKAWDLTTQDGCLAGRLSVVDLDQWYGHDSQIIGEMSPMSAWSFDFAKDSSGFTGEFAVPLWLVASLGLLITLIPWLPHRT